MAASLTNQGDESGQAAESAVTGQDRQAGSQGPGRVMAFTLGFLMGSRLLLLTKIEGKEILESIHQRDITVRYITFEMFGGCRGMKVLGGTSICLWLDMLTVCPPTVLLKRSEGSLTVAAAPWAASY